MAGPGAFTLSAIESDDKASRMFDERPSRFLAPSSDDGGLLRDARIGGIRHPALLALWIRIEKGRQTGRGPRQNVLDRLNDRRKQLSETDQ